MTDHEGSGSDTDHHALPDHAAIAAFLGHQRWFGG